MCYFIIEKCRLLFITNKEKSIVKLAVASIQVNRPSICERTLFLSLNVGKQTLLPHLNQQINTNNTQNKHRS